MGVTAPRPGQSFVGSVIVAAMASVSKLTAEHQVAGSSFITSTKSRRGLFLHSLDTRNRRIGARQRRAITALAVARSAGRSTVGIDQCRPHGSSVGQRRVIQIGDHRILLKRSSRWQNGPRLRTSARGSTDGSGQVSLNELGALFRSDRQAEDV